MPGYFSSVDPREFSEWDQTSPNVARAYARYAEGMPAPTGVGHEFKRATQYGPGTEASAPSSPGFFERLIQAIFGGTQPQQARPSLGGDFKRATQYGPGTPDYGMPPMESPAPAYQPQTKISSAPDIGRLISGMIGSPMPPPEVNAFDFGVPNQVGPQDFLNAENAAWQRFYETNPLPDDPPIPTFPTRRPSTWAGGWFEPRRRAHGGPVDMMRGGYPELYTQPMRRGFFSRGGDSYVSPDGTGNGRSDHIDARLSPGEFVVDAESVAMLGDGDNSAGARKLDQMRKNLRRHKGSAFARGKFSPKARKPESYLEGGK